MIQKQENSAEEIKDELAEQPSKAENPDNNDILKQIEDNPDEEKKKNDEANIKLIKFMVFRIKQKKYAIRAEEIREIVMDIPLFFVPFVPAYIRGFINRHGEPYTVFDLNVLFNQEELESSTYLVLNIKNDQLSLLITDVIEILKLPENEFHKITSEDEDVNYFMGSISPHDEEVFVLNLPEVLQRITQDLEGY